ncbi:hypothetical protein BWR18_20865 (plasmid) [Tateyamaria omphalii]|uniref:Prepilin leader peptidase/N-methyltransferase n=2 Tax=Tateyamaria omphalii TaxID=299262 RepID=A0A1P8N257_9RHOB|nr:hypothetical protein BWR18_20865 [Tateyamaria omphalii]
MLVFIAPAVGSFLTVLVDRLPRDEDVVHARSRCRSCQESLRAWDLVPLVSYIALRGRCRYCGANIPAFTFHVEAMALGAAGMAVVWGSDAVDMAVSALWLWILIALTACDLTWFRLPNVLTAALAFASLIMAVLPGGIALEQAMIGAVFGVGSFTLLAWGYQVVRHRVGLGQGDVKLMLGLGAFAGPFDLPLLVLVAALLALLFALLTARRSGGLDPARAVPFGAALCISGGILWIARAAEVPSLPLW